MEYDIADEELAEKGKMMIEWAGNEMPVLNMIGDDFEKRKPLKGLIIGGCLHITTETANLAITLKRGGAEVYLCASNPLSTHDDVAAALVKKYKIKVFALRGEDREKYYNHIDKVLDAKPGLLMDDGGDLISTAHTSRDDVLEFVRGGTEETTTGVMRFKSMEMEDALKIPIIAVNNAMTKHLFDNRYGTGQSSIDGIIRATNILLAGKKFVVCGYGWCGRGIAMRARGMGAHVIVTEVDPTKALEAVMDGFTVMPMLDAARIGDIFITATGQTKVIREEHIEKMKDGAILSNSGHFNVEIDLNALEKMSEKKRKVRVDVEEYLLKNGKRIFLLAEGRLVNLACAEGHPAAVMDMSFSNQALCAEYIYKNKLVVKVHNVPEIIDRRVAALKLKSMDIKIDTLTDEQIRYASSWRDGT